MQVLSTEMHRMSGVWLLSRTDDEKVKASDAVSKSVLRVAKVGHAAMQAANNATLWGASLWGDEWRVAAGQVSQASINFTDLPLACAALTVSL